MKNKLQQFIVKLLAATLAIIMAVPTNVFAMKQRKSNIYTAATSVMGIQEKDTSKEETENTDSSLIKSAVSTEETTDYIIEKSASLSKTTGQVDYKIVVKTKDPSKEFTENQTTTFAITENTDLKDLKVEKVQALDANSKETDLKYTVNTPKAFNNTDNLRTLGLTTTKPQYGMVYYLSAQLTEEALKNLEEKSPQLALDITIASPNQDIFQTRYSLETTKQDTTEITIDNDGNVANQTSELVEKEDNLHLYKGEYKKEEKTLFQTTPAHLVWTDYINAKDDKEFTLNFDLDENQDPENSQINIDYYEARDKGYVLNQSFSKKVDFANSLNLTIPQGYIAKVSLTTAIKENTNAKEYTFNGVKVANPTFKEEITEKTEEEQATDDADPLPDDSSKNDGETKPSNDSIADESKQDFSQNPKSDTSAIALNKEAYLENLKDEEKLTENLEKAANDIELALESYNKEETNWDEFKATIQTIAKEQNLDQAQTEETLQALLAGLNEDKYKVANIDTKEAITLVEESTDQSEPTDATEKSVDELVKEKLNEEGITIEDFQNYMYELEEKYGLTDEDAARIYGDNAEAIQALVTKAKEEKTTGDVFAVTNGFANKTFRLTTNMNVLSMPLWSIPSGWYFDINVGPYLYLDTKPKDLYVNGNRVATAEYFSATNTIRYTFTQSVYKTTSIPINQDFKFNTEAIGDKNPIDIKISVKPKNNPAQTQTYRVDANSNQNIYESKIILDQGEFTKTYGTHISRDEGNNIRYSYVPRKSIMNSYELAYRDMRNNDPDLSYYVLLKANPGDGSFTSDSTIDIGLLDGKKIRDLDVYSIPSTKLEGLRQSFVDGRVKEYLGSNFNPQQTKYGMDTSNIQVNLSSSQLNNSNSAYLIKVRAADVKDGETFRFRYKWQSGNDIIDNWDNVYTLKLANRLESGSGLDTKYKVDGLNATVKAFDDINAFRVLDETDKNAIKEFVAYCIDVKIPGPTKDNVYAKGRYVINSEEDLKNLIQGNDPDFKEKVYENDKDKLDISITNSTDTEKIYQDLATLFYMIEEGKFFGGNKKPRNMKESIAMSALVYRIIDGNSGKIKKNFYNQAEKYGYESWVDLASYGSNESGFYGNPIFIDLASVSYTYYSENDAKPYKELVYEYDEQLQNFQKNNDIDKITNSTTIYVYLNPRIKGESKHYQSVITGEITKTQLPDIMFKKQNDRGDAIAGAKFKLQKDGKDVNDGNGIIKVSNSNGEFGWTNLEDGSYTVIEVEAPEGYEPVNNQKVASFTVSNGTITNKSIAYAYNRNGNIANKSYTPTTSEFKFMKVNSTTNSPLAGAQFELRNTSWSGVSPKSNIAGEDGIIRFTNIPDGTYYLREIRRPTATGTYTFEDVALNQNLATIKFSDGTYTITDKSDSFKDLNGRITMGNAPDRYRGSFSIYKSKLDENGRGAFSNVTFTLKQTGGPSQQSPKTATTGTNGIATFTNLDEDTTWELTENTPAGYIDYEYKWNVKVLKDKVEITPASKSAEDSSLSTIVKGDSPTINVFNRKKIKLRVKKVDSTDESITLGGVVLGLFKNKSDTTPYKKSITNSNGIAEFTDLPYGETYYVKEIKGIDGYDTEIIDLETGQAGPKEITLNLQDDYYISDTNTSNSRFETRGTWLWNRPKHEGSYSRVNQNNNTIDTRVFIQTELEKETFSIHTGNSSNQVSYNDAQYTVYEVSSNEFNNLKSSADKFIPVSDKIDSKTAPISRSITFDGTNNKVERYFVVDISNISFTGLTPSSTQSQILTANYNVDVVAGDNRHGGNTSITAKITYANTPTEPTITVGNKPVKEHGKLKLRKIDGNNQVIAIDQAQFILQEKEAQGRYLTKNGEFTTDLNKANISTDKGEVIIDNIPEGTYTLKEVKSPEGYRISNAEWEVKVERSGITTITGPESSNANIRNSTDTNTASSIEVINYETEIKFKKTFSDNGNYNVKVVESLPNADSENAYFTLKDDRGNSYHETKYQSVANNTIIFRKLPLGRTYTLTEQAPLGFNDAEEYKFEIDQDGYVKPINFNYKAAFPVEILNSKTPKAKFAIKKIDADTNLNLAGATFTLTGGNLEDPIVKTTSENQNPIIFENLDVGQSYTLTETGVPVGYKDENKKYTVDIDKEGNVIIQELNGKVYDGLKTFTVANKKIPKGRFRIEKVDESNTPLDGVAFTLTPNSGTEGIEKTKTTKSNGIVEFVNLNPGSYTLVESETKAGYIKIKQSWNVDVNETDGEVTITTNNKLFGQSNIPDYLNVQTVFAAESSKTKNIAFVVENLRGKSEGVVEEYNKNINEIKNSLAELYGDNAAITLVANGHNAGQQIIHQNVPATSDVDLSLKQFDEGGGDSHLDEAIDRVKTAFSKRKASENYVVIMQSGKGEEYIDDYYYDTSKGFFTPEDNITNVSLYVEDPSADTSKYIKSNESGSLISDTNSIIDSNLDQTSLAEKLGEKVPNLGIDSPITDAYISKSHIQVLTDLETLRKDGYIITNSSDFSSNLTVLKVLNRRATYPSTGGSGTFIGFALIGTAIMLAGIAYYGIYVNDKNRRRSNRYGK